MIEIDHVSKSFGRIKVLDDVCLRIAAGERVAFVGANGSGKTTLLRAVLGLLRVEGSVRVAGIEVSRDPRQALARVAYVPQLSPPLDAPVGEVVRAYAALRAVPLPQMEACAQRLGLPMLERSRSRFRDLSGGMRQKLLAVMALSTRADVLVCDEPTANLDARARRAFFDEIAARWADKVILLCSHRAEEVSGFVERVIELRDGRVVSDDRRRTPTRATWSMFQ